MNMPTPKYCPATGNQPLTCTRTGFAASCAKFREHANRKWTGKANLPISIQSDYCVICQGRVPDNVTFIEIDEKYQTEKIIMASSKKFLGKCDSCGGDKVLSKHYGKSVCSSCLAFRIGCKSHPDWVVAALEEFGNLPVVDGSHVPPGDEKQAEIIETVKKILKVQANEDVLETATRRMLVLAQLEESYLQEAKALSDAEAARDDAGRIVDELKKENRLVHEENDVAVETLANTREYMEELKQENETLKNQLRQAADELRKNPPIDAHANHNSIDSALLDIALDIMAGNITGIDVDGLRRLRV